MYNYISIAIFALLVSVLTTFLAVKFFPKFGLLDKPQKYGLKRKPIAYFGGLAIYVSFWICAFLFVDFDNKLLAVLVASFILILMNFFDDLIALKWYIRLPIQFLVSLIVVFAGIRIFEISNPFGGTFALNTFFAQINVFGHNVDIIFLADLLVVFWIMTMMNSMNWMDGVNGLPSGLTFIASIVLFVLSIEHFHIVDQTTVATLSLILAFVSLGFWIFDFYPAKILMGDTGSMFLGFMLAILAVFSGAKIATTALVLGFPLLDFGWIVFRRTFIDKKSPFKGDLTHVHHRLLKSGFSERQTLFILYFICIVFGAISLLSSNSKEKLIAILVMAFAMIVFGMWVFLRKKNKRMKE